MFRNIILLGKYISRAAIGKCPKCCNSNIFYSHFKMKKSCNKCGAKFIEKNGDHWFFLLFIDRGLFIFPVIVAFYFEIDPRMIILLSLFLLAFFILITPFRLGVCLAFDFYLRSRMEKTR